MLDWLRGDENAGQDVFITRLHARYDERFDQDIALGVTADRQNFQGRYVMREPFRGELTCPAKEYVAMVRDRTKSEAEMVERLTGWPRKRIWEEIGKTVPAVYR